MCVCTHICVHMIISNSLALLEVLGGLRPRSLLVRTEGSKQLRGRTVDFGFTISCGPGRSLKSAELSSSAQWGAMRFEGCCKVA